MRKKFFIYTCFIFCLFACESIDVDKEHTILEFEIKNIEIDEIRISNSSYSHKKLIKNDKEKLEAFVDTLTLPLSGYYNLFFNRNNIPLYLRRGTKTKIVID